MKTLEVNITEKKFNVNGINVHVLKRINFSLGQNEFVSIIGPSGCGKSTILKIVMGLDTDYQGEILLNGRKIRAPGLDRGMVFQDHRLFPWLSVKENIGFALPKLRKKEYSQIKRVIDQVGLSGFEDAWPMQLSGGMAQRVALARAIVNIPEVLLLDEAFGALDDFTRSKMQVELKNLVDQSEVTTLMVTHNIDEAILLSDRVIVLSDKPASIIDELVISFTNKRDKKSEEFIHYRNKLISEL